MSSRRAATGGGPRPAPTSRQLRTLLEPHLTAAAAIAALTGHDAEVIGAMRRRDVQPEGAELAGGHVIPPHLQALIRAHVLARHAAGATTDAPLFLARDRHPAGPRSARGWLERVSRELNLNFITGYGFDARFDRARMAAIFGVGDRATTSDQLRRVAR